MCSVCSFVHGNVFHGMYRHIQNGNRQSSHMLVVCFLLMSLAVPSIPFRAWSCLVWSWQGVWQRTVEPLVAGWSSAESQSTVMDSSRSSCTCHWLSSRLSELGDKRGTGGEECVHANVCECVCVSGGWRLQWRGTDWDVRATCIW